MQKALRIAADILKLILSKGPMDVKKVKRRFEDAGCRPNQIYEARKEIWAETIAIPGSKLWYLPEHKVEAIARAEKAWKKAGIQK